MRRLRCIHRRRGITPSSELRTQFQFIMFAVYFLHTAAGRHALLGYRVLASAWRCAIVLFCTLLWLSLLLSLLLLLLLLLISLHTCTWFPSLPTAEIPVEFSEWINAWNRVSKRVRACILLLLVVFVQSSALRRVRLLISGFWSEHFVASVEAPV